MRNDDDDGLNHFDTIENNSETKNTRNFRLWVKGLFWRSIIIVLYKLHSLTWRYLKGESKSKVMTRLLPSLS